MFPMLDKYMKDKKQDPESDIEKTTVETPNPGIAATPEEALSRNFEVSPQIKEARVKRDEENRNTRINEALSEIGHGLSRSNQKFDPSFYDKLRGDSETKVKEAEGDAAQRAKLVSDYIRNQTENERAKQTDAYHNALLGLQQQANQIAQQNKQKEFQIKEEENKIKHQEREDAKNKPSDTQTTAATYGRRLEQAENAFKELGDAGYHRESPEASLESNLSNAEVPILGKIGLGGIAAIPGDIYRATRQSENSKKQEQAERNFVNATLRRESGAAINRDEFAQAEKQYFPRVGDTPDVLAQKAANRQQVLAGLKVASGPAWEKVPLINPVTKPKITPEQARAELERRKKAKGQ